MFIDEELWRFVNTFAPWLAALGSISAVIVSLYLARRDKSVRLEVSAGYRLMLTPNVDGPHPKYLLIKVVNIGFREAQVTNIGWKVGFLRKRHGEQFPIMDGMSATIPVGLKDGEEAKYFIPLNEQTNWLEKFARDYLQPYPRLRSRFVKVVVSTSVGKTFEQRIEKGLRKLMVTFEKELHSN